MQNSLVWVDGGGERMMGITGVWASRRESWRYRVERMRHVTGRKDRCVDRVLIVLIVVVVGVVNVYMILYVTSCGTSSVAGLRPDPNAPVILVADDAEDALPQRRAIGNVSAVWAAGQGMRQRNGSKVRWILLHAPDHGGGGLVAEAALNLHIDEIFFLHQPLYKLPPPRSHRGPAVWLQHLYNCSLSDDVYHLLHTTHLWRSRSFRATHASQCRPQQIDMARCVEMACKERKLRAVFTSRLSMGEVESLVKTYRQELKVVVVVRDPRAVLSARLRAHHIRAEEFQKQAELVCVSMAADLSVARDLMRAYPGALMVVHHEHLVLHPRRVLAAVNHFLGLEVSHRHLNATLALLSLDSPEEQRLQLINMWQLDFTLKETRQIDKGCNKYYHGLGYWPVPLTISTRTNHFYPWEETK